ncbi:MAG TPA: ABC transporter ATP-binding protein [Pyrinomonadaceae bacterium]
MSEIAISCENLSKQFRLGQQESYRALRDVVTSAVKAPFRRFRRNGSQAAKLESETIWALSDVSFEVQRGDIVGVIGRNGAGKSTLLKILSRITKPTHGFANIQGRVGSLLEVGTGFHAELTGRENIFLNGAILGMRKADIQRKFDEIVAFAEVEKFIDTPVKRYSSGMYVRLAFGVAVHMDPEVLVVDEVLAVGDAEFQKKCLRKVKEIGQGNRTILFVSHNMSAIRTICNNTLALDRGKVFAFGPTARVVDEYESFATSSLPGSAAFETPTFQLQDVSITSSEGPVVKTFDDVRIKLTITAKADVVQPDVYIGIQTADGQLLTALVCRDFCSAPALSRGETMETEFKIRELPLLPGPYELLIHLIDVRFKFEVVPATFPFEVVESSLYGGRKIEREFGHIGLKAEVTAKLQDTPALQVV